MKTKNLFLATIVTLFGVIVESSGQTDNTFTGNGAGTNNTGDYNSGFGVNSLQNNTSNSNSAFGVNTLSSSTGGFNCAFGNGALLLNGNGQLNCAIGTRALENNLTGSANIAIGHRSLGDSNISGVNNTAVGYASLLKSSGNNNTAIGYYSPRSLLSGNNNVFVGYQTAINLSNGSNNVFIGSNLTVPNSPATATSAGNNTNSTIIIGDGAGLQRIYVNSNGYTGIGLGNNQIPLNRLELNGGITGTSGLRFRNYTSAVNPTESANKFLTVNPNGDVVLQNLPPSSGTDSQTLSIVGNQLTISNGNTVNLPSSLSCNLYTCDGTLSTLPTNSNNPNPGLRTVTMGNNNLFFQTNSAFDGNGRVYIGASPNNFTPITATSRYRLFVEGGILTERVKVATNGTINWADYVFADDYKLMSLSEVESFVKENNHLPGIESAETLSKEGLDLGDMQAKQMAKIEELTLYVIQQNKEIEELKAQMKLIIEKTK